MSDGLFESLGIHFLLLKLLLIILGYWPFLAAIFIYLDLLFLWRIYRKKLKRPQFTQRSKIILSTGLLFSFFSIVIFILYGTLGLLLGELSLVYAPIIGIWITHPLVLSAKNKEVAEAKKILSKVKPVVIGITGSYGKTTTKEFTAHLLSQAYRVEKTRKNENTVFGVIRKICQEFDKKADFFVVEMGAYKKGEIRAITEIANPEVAVITGIEPQHLDLFGGIEEIKKTKFELIESLPQKALVLLNANNKYTHELAVWSKNLNKDLLIKTYGTGTSTGIKMKKIATTMEGIKFKVSEGKGWFEFFAPFVVDFFLENLCAAIAVSRHYKVSWNRIGAGIQNLTLPENTMNIRKTQNGAVIIDDTYNATPQGFESALNYLYSHKGAKRAVVTTGIIELGSKAFDIHKKLGKLAGDVCEQIVITHKSFLKAFARGVNGRAEIYLIKDSKKINTKVDDLVKGKYVILLEGRLPSEVINYIKTLK